MMLTTRVHGPYVAASWPPEVAASMGATRANPHVKAGLPGNPRSWLKQVYKPSTTPTIQLANCTDGALTSSFQAGPRAMIPIAVMLHGPIDSGDSPGFRERANPTTSAQKIKVASASSIHGSTGTWWMWVIVAAMDVPMREPAQAGPRGGRDCEAMVPRVLKSPRI